jgi:hypothetical protein
MDLQLRIVGWYKLCDAICGPPPPILLIYPPIEDINKKDSRQNCDFSIAIGCCG